MKINGSVLTVYLHTCQSFHLCVYLSMCVCVRKRKRQHKGEKAREERESPTLWSLISALSVRYKFLQGGDKYTAVPGPPPHPSFFLSPVLLHILALSCAKQMESIDMLMRQGLLHSSPRATSPHTHTHSCAHVYIQQLDIGMHVWVGPPTWRHMTTPPDHLPTHKQEHICVI